MALATEKLYYRRGGTTYSINTYTALSDVGSEALKVRVNGADRFIALGAVGDGRQSYMRVQKNGALKAILSTATVYVGVWTQIAACGSNQWIGGTFSFSYDRVFSTSNQNNLQHKAYGGPDGGQVSIKIDGSTYNLYANADDYAYAYYRLSTGSHTVYVNALTSRTRTSTALQVV